MKKFLFYYLIIFLTACGIQHENKTETKESSKKAEQNICSAFSNDILELAKQDPYLFFVVDKKNFLSPDYAPQDLVGKGKTSVRKQTFEAFTEMAKKAKEDGAKLFILSGFRPYKKQEYLFNRSVQTKGLEHAERYVARPGASQHQLGTAIDIVRVENNFINTKEYAWLKDNACNFGFSLSFPEGQEDKTGYAFESWHYRYITPEGCRLQKQYFNDSQVDFLNALNACLK